MIAQTILPVPAGLRGIIICEDDMTYGFYALTAMAVEQTSHDGLFFEVSYICLDGCVADCVVDAFGFVHGVDANAPLAEWEAENKVTMWNGV